LIAALLVAWLSPLLGCSICQAAPPEFVCQNEMRRQYDMNTVIERWELERNPIAVARIPARRIADSDEPILGIPRCGFSRPVFWSSGDEVVVDSGLFSDLRTVQARQAQKLGPDGIVVGRVRDAKHDPRQIVQLLVRSGVVDANIHVVATVSLLEEGRDAHGYWARLVSDDRFWTNQENRVLYDFAMRISDEGEIRLMNVDCVGTSSEPRE
jgi:hypothetical protein